VFILDPGLEEPKVNEEVERAAALIRDQGGTVDEVERWGRRRLAYEIAASATASTRCCATTPPGRR